MIMDEKKMSMRCPAGEELGALVDGELAEDRAAAVNTHLETCGTCREIVAAYRRIGQVLRRRGDVTAPEGMAERIKTALDLSLENSHPKTIRFPRIFSIALRVAAMVAIGGTVVLYTLQPKNSPVASTKPETALVRPGTELAAYNKKSGDKFPYFSTSGTIGGTAVPLNSLVDASYGENPSPIFTGGAAGAASVVRRNRPVAINDLVRQVWAVSRVDAAKKQMEQFGRAAGLNANQWRLSDDGRKLLLSARLNKNDLVKLVRDCRSAGFELLSPEAPQPEQRYFVGNPTDPVVYHAEFVADAP